MKRPRAFKSTWELGRKERARESTDAARSRPSRELRVSSWGARGLQ